MLGLHKERAVRVMRIVSKKSLQAEYDKRETCEKHIYKKWVNGYLYHYYPKIYNQILNAPSPIAFYDIVFIILDSGDDGLINLFYEYAESNKFYNLFDLRVAIDSLATLDDLNKNNETIQTLLRSPVINDISFDGNHTFSVDSVHSHFDFLVANKYFNNEKLMEHMKNFWNPLDCHQNTEILLRAQPDIVAVTALCKEPFGACIHHSYGFSKPEQLYVETSLNALFSLDVLQAIWRPYGVSCETMDTIDTQLYERVPKRELTDTQLLLERALFKLKIREGEELDNDGNIQKKILRKIP